MKDKIYRFMRSRYGNDQLSSALTWGGLILMVIDAFAKIGIFYIVGLALFVYGYIRIFSKNYDKRAAQNRWFMEHTAGIRNFSKRMKKQKEAGKDYKVFVCSKCQQMIRVPRGRGKIEIRCPKCNNRFVKKS
jgi:membrane-bound ClpP family serine protease